uniref:Uncharacterized protein n=1 Tax=Poecilia formosa TaxID=48698 RepID=A0A087X6L5_POEFO
MEKAVVHKDVKSFEYSPSELDRAFFGEQSFLSASSLDQLSTSKPSNAAGADGFDGRSSILASLCLSSDAISPSVGFLPCGFNMKEADCCNLSISPQGKFSTPRVLSKEPRNSVCFDQSHAFLSASQVSLDVSVIKSESNSPRFFIESGTQEQTWSPKPQLPEDCPDQGA